MIDRSIDLEEFPPAETARRGNISSCIWTIENALGPRMTRLSMQLEMVLRPPVQQGEQVELIIRYLEGMAKLDYYMLRNPNGFSSVISDYFDVNWPLGRKEIPVSITVTNHQSIRIKR